MSDKASTRCCTTSSSSAATCRSRRAIGKGLGAEPDEHAGRRYSFAKTRAVRGVSFEGAGIIKKDDWNGAFTARAPARVAS